MTILGKPAHSNPPTPVNTSPTKRIRTSPSDTSKTSSFVCIALPAQASDDGNSSHDTLATSSATTPDDASSITSSSSYMSTDTKNPQPPTTTATTTHTNSQDSYAIFDTVTAELSQSDVADLARLCDRLPPQHHPIFDASIPTMPRPQLTALVDSLVPEPDLRLELRSLVPPIHRPLFDTLLNTNATLPQLQAILYTWNNKPATGRGSKSEKANKAD